TIRNGSRRRSPRSGAAFVLTPPVLPSKPRASGLLHAATLNLRIGAVGVDRIEMRMAAPETPHEFFADIVNACVRVDRDLVGAFAALDAAEDLVGSGRNDE